MKYIVMQHRLFSKSIDDEGFASSRIEVKEQSNREIHRPIRDKIPQPKQLIHLSRPQDEEPRVLDAGVQITLLPQCMNSGEQQERQPNPSTLPLSKIQFSGKGKSLCDYFLTGDYVCVYEKYKDKRSIQEIYYDFTSRIKIIDHSNDYNQKLYKKLAPPNLHTPDCLSCQFDSNFQSGNARYVYKQFSKPHNYYLLLENDTNTHGYNQWFFFRVRNRERCAITVHILNLIKKQSLYKQGMKIAIFSIKQHEINKRGWYRGGTNIGYNNTGIERTTKQNQPHYCLSFSFEFEHEDDCVYFALTVPYTYSKVGLFFRETANRCYLHQIPYSQKTLGYTLSNNKIRAMRIGFGEQTRRKVIVVLARQHPCETMGSFVCEGFVKALTSNSIESQSLLAQFNFVIIPMVNPDGVIEGNSRCNLSGIDLNRQWIEPIKQLTPQTFYIKRYLQKIHQQYSIESIIDLHGHSKKLNSFFYCCDKKDKVQMRLFSIMMSKLCEQFDYTSCTYGLTKDKFSTIRGRFHSLGVDCYTLENSYLGWFNKTCCYYTAKEFSKIGEAILKALFLIHCSANVLELGYTFDRYTVTEEIKKNIYKLEVDERINQEDSGSDSDPDGDLFDIEERLTTLKMKSLLKSGSNQSILKGLSSVSKVTKYQSPLVISHRKGLQKNCNQTLKLKRRKKGKHSLNIEPGELQQEQNSFDVVKKTTQPTAKVKKQKLVTDRSQVGRQMRLASSLNKPTRLQYFAHHQQRGLAQMTKVHSNQNFEQPTFVRKRPSSSYRTQTRFVNAIKKRQRISRVHTEGQQSKARRTTMTQSSSRNEYKSRSPDEKELKVIEVSYLQQRRQRSTFMQQRGIMRSKELRGSNLISDNKFRRFESFVDSNNQRLPQSISKQLGNRVFYRFPVL